MSCDKDKRSEYKNGNRRFISTFQEVPIQLPVKKTVTHVSTQLFIAMLKESLESRLQGTDLTQIVLG